MPISNKRSVLVWIGLAVSHLLFATAAEAQRVSFIARRDYAVGTHAQSVAVGDFNRDGFDDLVMTHEFGVSVLLSNGDRSFYQAWTSRFVGGSSLVVADLNGDSIPDIIIAAGDLYYGRGIVSVLLGNGDGTFRGPLTYHQST